MLSTTAEVQLSVSPPVAHKQNKNEQEMERLLEKPWDTQITTGYDLSKPIRNREAI